MSHICVTFTGNALKSILIWCLQRHSFHHIATQCLLAGGSTFSTSRGETNCISKGLFNGQIFFTGNTKPNLDPSRIAAGAFHNSEERFDTHPGTRIAVLDDIMRWIQVFGRIKGHAQTVRFSPGHPVLGIMRNV